MTIATKEELCRKNRSSKDYIDNLPEIANSDLRLYPRKVDFYFCHTCDNNTTHKGRKYCLLDKPQYEND